MLKGVNSCSEEVKELLTQFQKDNNIADELIWEVNFGISRDELIIKRSEMNEFIKEIIPFIQINSRKELIISGGYGSGKTHLIKYYLKILSKQEDFEVFYISCLDYSSSHHIMKKMLGIENKKDKYSVRVLFEKKFNNRKCILILDEADLLIDDEIIYKLKSDPKFLIMIIFITNKSNIFYQKLQGKVRSRINLKPIAFRSYNDLEILEILKRRCQYGLKEFKSDELDLGLLRGIAANNVKTFDSDVRIGIVTTKEYFGDKSIIKKEINGDDIKKTMKEVADELELKKIEGLSLPHLKLLLSICDLLRTDEDGNYFPSKSNDIRKRFIFNYPNEANSHTHILKKLNQIAKNDLIFITQNKELIKRKDKQIKNHYVKEITLNIQKKNIQKIYELVKEKNKIRSEG